MRHLRLVAGLLWCVGIATAIYLYAIGDVTGTGDVIPRLEGLINAFTGTSFVIGLAVTRRADHHYISVLATVGSALLFGAVVRAIGPFVHSITPSDATANVEIIGGSVLVAGLVWFYFAGTLWFGGAIRRQFVRAYDQLRRRPPPD